ncbi:MAG: hypothetical protein JJ873_09020 [Maricaulis sp.]|nr:hypothetical protein [Maricaulis sp.]
MTATRNDQKSLKSDLAEQGPSTHDSGKALAARAARDLWPVIDAAVAELCADLDGGFIDQIAALEARLSSGVMQDLLDRKAEERGATQ